MTVLHVTIANPLYHMAVVTSDISLGLAESYCLPEFVSDTFSVGNLCVLPSGLYWSYASFQLYCHTWSCLRTLPRVEGLGMSP